MSEISLSTEAPVSGHTTRRLQTRRKLLDAGTRLFADRGVGDVTTSAIASEAGMATGTFYLHFDDKHALFEVLVQEALDEMRAQLHPDRLEHGGQSDRRAGMEGVVDVAERRRDLIRAVFDRGETSGLADRIQDRLAERLEPDYRQIFDDKGIGLHPGGAAQARAAVLVRVIAWWVEDPSRASRNQVVDLLLQLDPLRLPAAGQCQQSSPNDHTRQATNPPATDL